MKVIIFGVNGMLGQELVRVFSDADVLALDATECDITDATAVQTTLERAQPNIIINAAAYNAVDKAQENPAIANKVNGEAVGTIAQMSEKLGATFVHYSSDYVFDGTKKKGYREDDAPNPVSAYGKSKLLGESFVQSAISNLKSSIYLIRLSRLFGTEGDGKKSFVDTMLDRAQNTEDGPLWYRGPSSPVVEVVDEERASPTYAPDLAQRTRDIVWTWKKPAGIYHATNSGACTWFEFAQEIFTQAKEYGILDHIPTLKAVPSSHFPRPAKRPMYSQLLNTKLPPMRPWQEALREYLEQKESPRTSSSRAR